MRFAVAAWLWSMGLAAPAREPPETSRVVAFGDDTQSDFEAQWSATRAHLQAAQFTSDSVAPPREATRAELARSLAGEAPGLVAVFWWLPTPQGLRLFAFVPDTETYLRREIPIAEGEEAAAIESLAVIIATTAEALRFGDEVAMLEASAEELDAAEAQLDKGESKPEPDPEPEPEPEPDQPGPYSEPEPEPKPEPDSRPRAWVSVHYLGELIAREAWWRSGMGVRAGLGPRPAIGIEVGYSFSPAFDFDLSPADGTGRSARHTVEAVVAWGREVHPRVELSVGLGPQLELWPWRANGVGGLRPHFRGLVEASARIRLSERWYLPCTFFSAVSTSSLDFVVCADGSTECSGAARSEVLSPFWVRGGARIGVGARF